MTKLVFLIIQPNEDSNHEKMNIFRVLGVRSGQVNFLSDFSTFYKANIPSFLKLNQVFLSCQFKVIYNSESRNVR